MICEKCGNNQIGGGFCSQCGSKIKEKSYKFQETDDESTSETAGQTVKSEKKKFTAQSKKSELPPPPEMVARKIKERSKFQRKGIGLFLFWVTNLLMRSLESVLFFGVFHLVIWVLLMIGNFFGGLVAPEAEINYPLLIVDRQELYKWEYIAFIIITVFTFRKRWGT